MSPLQEDAEELRLSLEAIYNNLESLRAGGVSWQEVGGWSVCPTDPVQYWWMLAPPHAPPAPRPPQFCVFIVVDGREKMSPSVAEFCEHTLGIWRSDMIVTDHKEQAVTCHVFERTVCPPSVTADPLQVVLAVKERNGGKLNSHLWFFSAFMPQLDPAVVVVRVPHTAPRPVMSPTRKPSVCAPPCAPQLLDVGTCPQPGAIAKLCRAFLDNHDVGGVCGEIAARDPNWFNFVEASQHYEYKSSHVLDKGVC